MTRFNEIQKTVIKDFISRDVTLVRRLWNPQIHDERINIIFDDELMMERLSRLATDIVADSEIITKVYCKLKFENKLSEIFLSSRAVEHTDLTVNEWELLFNHIGQVYESGKTQNHQCALDELSYLIKTGELWKLFENEADVEFLLPEAI